jgi:RAB protein geranylgeranyltransferase component A
MDKYYDVVVYKASLYGIFLAEKFKKENKKVLILNNLGFCGGEITETLNLLQKKNGLNKFGFADKFGYLYEDSESVVLEPETVKFYLHKFLVESNIEHLFYVHPFKVEGNRLFLMAKEGEVVIDFGVLIDASETYDILRMMGYDLSVESAYVHLLTNRTLPTLIPSELYKFLNLKDNRSFVTIANGERELVKIDNRMTEILIDFESKIFPIRLQIVPGNTHIIFEEPENYSKGNVVSYKQYWDGNE